MKNILVIATFIVSFTLFAQEGRREKPSPEVRAALQACAQEHSLQVGPDAPKLSESDRVVMRECMKAKGITKGPPPRAE